MDEATPVINEKPRAVKASASAVAAGHKGDEVFGLLPPIFRDCVDPLATRYNLALPWHEGGHAYASDGRIAVRCPIDEATAKAIDEAREGGGKAPKGAEMFDTNSRLAFRTDPAPLPDLPPRFLACRHCHGFGWLGEEDNLCPECEGGKSFPNRDRIAVDPGTDFQAGFLCVLAAHGAALHLATKRGPSWATRPAWFVIEGEPRVEGYLMPLRDEATR